MVADKCIATIMIIIWITNIIIHVSVYHISGVGIGGSYHHIIIMLS